MERGWSAKGLLAPLYGRVGGRDKLAKRAGTNGSTLSSINTGETNLGYDLGRRLAAVLGVTLEELGAPPDIAHPSPILSALAEINERLAKMDDPSDGHLASQSRLLAELAVAQESLQTAAGDLVAVASGLRREIDELAKQSSRRRPA